MSKLDELIAELCPDGVDFKPLEQCCTILDNKRKPVTKASRQEGEYPYYGANGIQDYVAEYIFDGTFILVGEDGSVITPNGTPVVNWAEGKIWVNNHAHIIEEKSGVLLRYLYHYLQIVNVKPLIHGNIPKLTGGDFRAIQIPVPPLPVQSEIVRILDSFTELTAELTEELTAELTARKKQYEHYKAFLFEDKSIVTMATTKDVTIDRFWLMPATPKFIEDGIPYITSKNVRNGKIDFSDVKYIAEKDFETISKNRSLKKDDLLITMIGTIGELAFVDDNVKFYGQNMYVIRFDETKCLRKYFYYFLSMKHIKNSLISRKNASSQGYIKAGNIENLSFPLPPIEKQKQIVSILDRFDNLCNDINDGLPAEITARQKQYEYYRDILLTFKPVA